MIGVDTFASVFGGQPAHTADHLVEHVRAIIRAGYSPVLCRPGTKEPLCPLSAAAAKRADKDARERALALNPRIQVDRIRHPCGFKHVLDDPGKAGSMVKRLADVHGGLNVALHLGRSRMLVVDVDTPAERQAFTDAMGEASDTPGGGPDVSLPGITVESPGTYDQTTGQWKHWGGGHWWFTLPDDYQLPPGKVLKMPGGWAIMYGESYALVPPASRPEGPYRLVGGTSPAPGWVLEQLTVAGEIRAHTADQNFSALPRGGPIDRWSALTSWASLLEPAGWIETSMVEGSCGCPVWTAPGDHASPKSATAHDLSCARFDVSEGWGPLKIWTDHPPDGLPASGTVTKLQFVAAVGYGGDDGAAIAGLGIERAPLAPAWAVPAEWQRPQDPMTPREMAQLDALVMSTPLENQPEPFGTPGGPTPDPSRPQAGPAGPGDEEERPSWADVDLSPYLNGDWEPPVPSMLPRSDGLCLIYPGLTHSIHGESESGKSWIAQYEAARLVKLGFHVKYVDFESDPGQVTYRMMTLGCSREDIRIYFHYSSPEVKPGADLSEYEAWSKMFTGSFSLVVIDGVTDALGLWGLKTSDNDDFTSFSRAFPKRLAKETGAGVLMVDHVTKSPEGRGRFALGGQAKMNSLTGAAYVIDVVEPMGRGLRGVLALGLAKDRAGYLRGRAGTMDRSRVQPIAEIILDASMPGHGLLVAINPPALQIEELDERTAKIVSYIQQYPGQSQSVIARETGIRPADVIPVLKQLESSGKLVIERIGQKHTHTLIVPINMDHEGPLQTDVGVETRT